MDVTTPLKISLFTQTLNAVLDPLLIFGLPSIGLPALGVGGAAMATSIAEVASVCIYLRLMLGRKLLSLSDLFRMPKVASLRAMMAGGTAVQLRSLALNLTFICVTRATLAMDATGTSAAAHTLTIQMWQLGGIALLALSSIASALVPKRLNEAGGGQLAAKVVADRLLWWGLLSGSALGVLQMLGLPLLKVFTSLPDVQSAAMIPSIIGASLQLISGVVFCGEGIMQGHQAFGRLALNTAAASAGLLTCLHFFGSSLTGVWCSFWVFNGIRLVFALQHHWVAGPLAPARLPALKAA